MNNLPKCKSKNKINNRVPKLNIKLSKNETNENLLVKNMLKISNSNRNFGQDITNNNAVKLVSPLMPVNTFQQKASSLTKKASNIFYNKIFYLNRLLLIVFLEIKIQHQHRLVQIKKK